MAINNLDIVIVIVVSLFTAYGIWKGMVKQVFSIAGIIAGYLVASAYYADFASFLRFNDPNLGKIVSFVLIFLACILVSAMLSWIINKFFNLPGLGLINGICGGLIGFLKGFLLVAIAVILMIALLASNNPLISSSVTVPYVLKGLNSMEKMVPADIKATYIEKRDDLIKELPGTKQRPRQK